MGPKISNDYVDTCLINRNIKRLSECTDTETKCEWLCLKCSKTWISTCRKVIRNNRGCHNCNKCRKLTDSEIYSIANSNNFSVIKIIENCKKRRLILECKICLYTRETNFTDGLRNNSCPQCVNRLKLSNESIDEKIEKFNIKRLDDYINAHAKINFQCKKCEHIWKAPPTRILVGKGCRKCGGNFPLTNKIIDKKISNRPTIRIGNYKNILTKIEWACLKCFNIWKTTPSTIIYSQSDCPECHKLHKNEFLILNFLKDNNVSFESQKYIDKINENVERNCVVDFYFSDLSLIIEYNGAQHYKPVRFGNRSIEAAKNAFEKQILRDAYLRKFCHENQLKLIEIDGRVFNNEKLLPDIYHSDTMADEPKFGELNVETIRCLL